MKNFSISSHNPWHDDPASSGYDTSLVEIGEKNRDILLFEVKTAR